MVLTCYLAMTAGEIAGAAPRPRHPAWMACHLSPYGTGLSNCPDSFPTGAMLIVNDRTPAFGHDPELIASQLTQLAEEFAPEAVLLDFQRPDVPLTAAIAKAITGKLPCPVGVSSLYAEELTCPVFLPPPPLHQPLKAYLAPWDGRELWLEAALNSEEILVTDQGSRFIPIYDKDAPPLHGDAALHCHYRIALSETEARFTLTRTAEDLGALLQEAEAMGVRLAVGLYQELGAVSPEKLNIE